MDAETRREVQEEVRRQVNIILFGSTAVTSEDAASEDIDSLFPGMPTILQRPVMHPYGFVSRAVKKTISVVARVGDHIGNRMVIGHRDAGRPTDLDEGESSVYAQGGPRVNVRNSRIELGSTGASEPVVLGQVLLSALTEFNSELKALVMTLSQTAAGLSTAPGNPIAPNPAFTEALEQLSEQIDQAKSTYISEASSNIVSQRVFTERGGGS